MFPRLELGPLSLPVSGLALLLGLWLGMEAAERTAPRYGIRQEHAYGLTGVALLGGVLGARLGYAARYLDSYLSDPAAIIALNVQTMDISTGFVAASLAALLYTRWQRLPPRPILDSLAPGMALFAVALGVAHLASGKAFGAPAAIPWAVELWDARRHPTQLYEIIAALAIFTLIWRLRPGNPFPGFLFSLWLALAAMSRLFLEAYRGDSIIVAGTVREAQLAALLLVIVSLWLLGRWARLPVGDSRAPE